MGRGNVVVECLVCWEEEFSDYVVFHQQVYGLLEGDFGEDIVRICPGEWDDGVCHLEPGVKLGVVIHQDRGVLELDFGG